MFCLLRVLLLLNIQDLLVRRNETSITSNSLDSMPGNNTRIVLVHGAVSDGSIWSKVIPILTDAGHRVIAVQLPLHSLVDDIATVERVIESIRRTYNSCRTFIWWRSNYKCRLQ